MHTEDRDRELARLFEQQRRADELSAPALRELLARPRREAPRRAGGWRIALVGATAAAAIAGVVLLRPARHRDGGQDGGLAPAALQLASWKAPTDALLETPGSELWTRVPILVSQDSPAVEVQPARPVQTTKGVGK